MFVSVVIPVYNRMDLIKQCLESVLKQDFEGDYEVIVVDDGSTDATSSIVRSFNAPRLCLVRNDINQGMCYSRNKGIAQARGSIIAFIDSDCLVDPLWLSELTKPFDPEGHIVITGGRIVDPVPSTYWEKVNNGMNYIAPVSGYVARIIGCNMAFQRQFLIDHPFDENLKTADEWDLCIRAEHQNKKIFYTDKAIVTHYHRYSLKDTMDQHFSYGYSNVYLKRKHGQFPFFNYGAFVLLAIMLCLAIGLFFHQFYYCAGIFSLFYAVLTGYWNTRGGSRTWREWVVTYPGYALAYFVFCLGNLSFILMYQRNKKK